MGYLKIVFTALKVAASFPALLLLPEAATEVEGFRRRSEDRALCRSRDGSLRRSSLLEDLLSVSFGWSVLLGEAEVLPPADLVLLCPDEPVCPGHELLHGGYGVHDQLCPELDARAHGQLKGFHRHLLRGTLDLAVNSPEATGELGDVLVLSHPEGHQVNIDLWDDAVGLELLQEGRPKQSPTGDGASRE